MLVQIFHLLIKAHAINFELPSVIDQLCICYTQLSKHFNILIHLSINNLQLDIMFYILLLFWIIYWLLIPGLFLFNFVIIRPEFLQCRIQSFKHFDVSLFYVLSQYHAVSLLLSGLYKTRKHFRELKVLRRHKEGLDFFIHVLHSHISIECHKIHWVFHLAHLFLDHIADLFT